MPKAEMLRFTVTPDNVVVPDFKKKLPGKGIWVKNSKSILEKSIQKNLFSKIAKKKLKTDESLLAVTQELLKKKALSAVSLARKAGVFVCGFEKTADKIKKGQVAFILEAGDAGADGHQKILAMANGLKIFACFTTEELDKELDRVNTVHAAFLKSEMSKAVDAELTRYENFLNS